MTKVEKFPAKPALDVAFSKVSVVLEETDQIKSYMVFAYNADESISHLFSENMSISDAIGLHGVVGKIIHKVWEDSHDN